MITNNLPETDSLSDISALTNALPDASELEKLANAYFSALPCDGTGKGIDRIAAAINQPIAGEASRQAPEPFGADVAGASQLQAELQKLMLPGIHLPKHTADYRPSIPETLEKPGFFEDDKLRSFIHQPALQIPGEADLRERFKQTSTLPANEVLEKSLFYFVNDNESFHRYAQLPPLQFAHPAFDITAIRKDFPILQQQVNGHPLVWLDNAATTQKPRVVIDRLSGFYARENSNIHRAAHELAARATDAYEKARQISARFINASSADEIIFVRGTTEGINLVAQSWGRQFIKHGDEIVITWLEHHANIVPWQQLCAETGAVLRVAPVDNEGQVILHEYQKLLTHKTRLVSFTQVSNALGTVTPAQQMIEMAHRVGAKVLLDGAQSVSHLRADVQALDCDWFVFSGHKVFAPTGIGVLYGKPGLLEAMPPWQGGGNMIEDVTFEKTTYQPAPAKFEAGTGNIADAAGLGAALEYVNHIGIDNIARYEHELLVYAMDALRTIPGLKLIGIAPDKTSVLSFVLDGHSNQDIGVALNQVGIAVRTGHHCAQPILRRFGLESTVRPSLAFYNTHEEIDHLVNTVRRIQAGKVYSHV